MVPISVTGIVPFIVPLPAEETSISSPCETFSTSYLPVDLVLSSWNGLPRVLDALVELELD